MAKWYKYITEENVWMVVSKQGNANKSGSAEYHPEYLAWVEEGNVAEEWDRNDPFPE